MTVPATRLQPSPTHDRLQSPAAVSALRKALLTWYRRQRRDLPWRGCDDPYRIWLSETMLQQTRVETVKPYFARFVDAFPTVAALAAAPLERVLQLWAGLGYYSRARNLHQAAKIVAQRGRFPDTVADLRQLPGVGRYTAGAVASIAFAQPAAAVDGNVKRVLARWRAIDDPIDDAATLERLWDEAGRLLDRRAPGDFNQALMELGATVCRPRKPLCAECPVRRWCAAAARGLQEKLPVRRARTEPQSVTAVALWVERGGRVLMMQRPAGGVLAGLWTLPGAVLFDAQPPDADMAARVLRGFGLAGCDIVPAGVVRHDFTHRRWTLHVFVVEACRGRVRGFGRETLRWVTRASLAALPLAALDRKVIAIGQASSEPTTRVVGRA
jgi:A/G-specific adenine glycosylase